MPYQSIVFMQGDDANEPLDTLYCRESEDSIVYHGPTAESIAAAFAYVMQWENGDPTEEYDQPSGGPWDRTWVSDCGGYILTANLSYGYIGLERIIALPVESYRCPCCGDDVMDTRPVCGDCREAGCKATVDACGELDYWGCERDDQGDDLTEQAEKIGAEHGRNAASWVIDGRTDHATLVWLRKRLDEGDPAVYDAYRTPDLSGEYAGDYLSGDLMRDLGAEHLPLCQTRVRQDEPVNISA